MQPGQASLRKWTLATAVLVAIATVLAGCGGSAARRERYVDHGRRYFEQGDYAKARVEFRNALQIAPKDISVTLWVGHSEERLGQLREAAGLYQSVVDSTPDNVEARGDLARLYAMGGLPQQALQLVEPALAKQPNNSTLLAVRGLARSRSGDAAGAEADAQRALQIDPANNDAVALLAGIYRAQGKAQAAADLVQKALARRPEATDLRVILVSVFADQGQLDRAEEQIKVLILQRPRELLYRQSLARVYDHSGRVDDAQKVLQDATEALPQNDDAKLMLANYVAEHRTRQQGEQILRNFLSAESDNNYLRLGLGALLQQGGRISEAIETYNQVVVGDSGGPNGIAARNQLARIYRQQGRSADAQRELADILRLSPRDDDALLMHGEYAAARRDFASAIADDRAVLRDLPNSSIVQRDLATALLGNGQAALAEDQLRSAITMAPSDVELRLQLAQLQLGAQRVDAAIGSLQEAVRAIPDNGALREALVRAELAKGDFEAAANAASEVEILQPKSAGGAYLAGIVAQARAKPDEAEANFVHALELQPGAIEPLLALTKLRISRGKSEAAIKQLQKVIVAQPRDGLAYELLGEVYLSTKAYAQAADALVRATTLAPSLWYAFRNLALARSGSGDVAGTVAAYQAGIEANPSQPQLVAELASYYLRQGRIDNAIALYDTLHAHDPDSTWAASNLALLLATYRSDQKSLDRARDLSASFATSTDATLMDTCGWVQLKRGEIPAALTVLERAAAGIPTSTLVRYHLAMAELRAGQRQRGLQDLRAAVSGTASYPGVEQARSILTGLGASG